MASIPFLGGTVSFDVTTALILVLFILFQMYAPKLGHDTWLSKRWTELTGSITRLEERISTIEQRQEDFIQVFRAFSRVEEDIDEEIVDDTLYTNSTNADDFIRSRNGRSAGEDVNVKHGIYITDEELDERSKRTSEDE